MTDSLSVSASELHSPLALHVPAFETTAILTGDVGFGQQRAHQALLRFIQGPACSVLFATGLPGWEIRHHVSRWCARLEQPKAVFFGQCQQVADLVGRRQADGTINPGWLQRAASGVLLLTASDLLAQPKLAQQLFSVICAGHFTPLPAQHRQPQDPDLAQAVVTRVVICGSADQHEALFQYLAPGALRQHQLMEFAGYLAADKAQVSDYLGWLQAWLQHENLPALDHAAAKQFIWLSSRICEHQQRLTLCFSQVQVLLHDAHRHGQHPQVIDQDALDKAHQAQLVARALPAEQSLASILQEQVMIETRGQRVGQVNGLSVLEWAHYCFGEPCRLSAVVHVGDGEVADIEDNAELAGSLHTKGVQLLSAWLSAQFGHQDPLPLSASIAFEQSHETIDGDSASVSLLCALLSALSSVPIKQGLAITGAVDQFGRVMAVGGINEKIEGFFALCKARGLDGSQGVILPRANQPSLALPAPIREAVSAGQFHIWAVDTVEQALGLLTGVVVDAEDDKGRYLTDSVFGQIEKRLRQLHEQETTPQLWQRLKMALEDWFR